MRFHTLADWLTWQETLHPKAIDLGLERVAEVARRMDLLKPPHRIITVAGTNGKGSSVALLESILRAAGLRVGAYTSPHLWRYNERIRIHGHDVADQDLIEAFAHIDQARSNRARPDISLSYFEFGTLAAFDLLQRAELDVAVLEVGLGGRLDAVNILDADAALVTGIGIDHVEWLGADRAVIGREKAGIFRAGRPAICSDPAPPSTVQAHAESLDAPWYALGDAFGYTRSRDSWTWWGPDSALQDLPLPALPGAYQFQNAAGVLMVLQALASELPVTLAALRDGLQQVCVAGRFQVSDATADRSETIYDVAHNAHAAAALARSLAERPCRGRTLAVCAMLADKDAAAIAAELKDTVQVWFLGGLTGARGQSARDLAARMALPAQNVHCLDDPAAALQAARAFAQLEDRIVVFGSFHTIAELLPPGL